MKRIFNKFKGYTLEDCDCKYCVYYGGKRKGKVSGYGADLAGFP